MLLLFSRSASLYILSIPTFCTSMCSFRRKNNSALMCLWLSALWPVIDSLALRQHLGLWNVMDFDLCFRSHNTLEEQLWQVRASLSEKTQICSRFLWLLTAAYPTGLFLLCLSLLGASLTARTADVHRWDQSCVLSGFSVLNWVTLAVKLLPCPSRNLRERKKNPKSERLENWLWLTWQTNSGESSHRFDPVVNTHVSF